MDRALDISGDYSTDANGLPYMTDGVQELLQQAYIMLTAKRGGYIYDRELGCNTYSDKKELEAAAREALAELPQAEVVSADITDGEATVTILLQGEEYDITIRREE